MVSDYDEISPFYHQKKLNLVVADYRGYGASSGIPTLTDLVQDCHVILKEIVAELSRRNLRKDLWVMGRSLGSISALELAHKHQDVIKGLIIESGFPSVVRIITHLGIPAPGIDLEKIDQGCLEMIEEILAPLPDHPRRRRYARPSRKCERSIRTPWNKGERTSRHPSATHNDVLIVGFRDYFKAIQRWTKKGETEPRSG